MIRTALDELKMAATSLAMRAHTVTDENPNARNDERVSVTLGEVRDLANALLAFNAASLPSAAEAASPAAGWTARSIELDDIRDALRRWLKARWELNQHQLKFELTKRGNEVVSDPEHQRLWSVLGMCEQELEFFAAKTIPSPSEEARAG